MMKMFASNLLQAFLVVATLSSRATAELAVVSYINGVLSTADTQAVELAVSTLSSTPGTRRALRTGDRNLWTAKCSRYCSGWPKDQCYIVYSSCTVRRSLHGLAAGTEDEPEEDVTAASRPNVRALAVSSPACDAKIAATSSALMTAVSADGQPLIVNSTSFLCFEDCTITNFVLWNADCDVVTRPSINDGAMICRNDYGFNIQVLTDDCVDSVSFQLVKDSVVVFQRLENSGRYTLFGNIGTNLNGPDAVGLQNLAEGSYTLTATPDNYADLAQSITFTLMDC